MQEVQKPDAGPAPEVAVGSTEWAQKQRVQNLLRKQSKSNDLNDDASKAQGNSIEAAKEDGKEPQDQQPQD